MIWLSFFVLICGALLTLAFLPFNVYSLGFILPAVLLGVWLKSSPKKAFLMGLLFGAGFFGTGASWIYISIHRYGNASVLLSIGITALFVLFLSLYLATLGYVFRQFFSKKSTTKNCLFVFPALWVLWEYLRSTLFTGFPWLLLGYTQMSTPLKGLAPVIGVYGLSLVVAMISGALVLLASKQMRFIKAFSLLVIFGWMGLGWAMRDHAWTKPFHAPMTVSLIQGDIPQTIKWNEAYVIQNINVYKHLTFNHWTSQLIVWPEGAFPLYASDAKQFIQKLGALAKENYSNVLFGVPIADEKTKSYYNGMLLIGQNQGEYLKKHLVPFGEYTPLQKLFSTVMKHFNIPMSGFSQGPSNQPDLKINHIILAPFICYEITFPVAVLDAANHSNLFVTISDDSWFGQSVALAQHLQMAEMRSLETGRPQILSTNTGITAFISPFGDIIKSAPINERAVLTHSIQPMQGKTPLMQWNYYPVMILVILMLII